MVRSARETLALGFGWTMLWAVESFRVFMNGTVRVGGMRGSEATDSRSCLEFAFAIVASLRRLSRNDDLFRLCLDVRLSSYEG